MAKKLVFDKTYENIGVAESHFGTHDLAISFFVVVPPNEKQLGVRTSSARRSSVSELGSLTVR